MKPSYIHSAVSISAQNTFDEQMFFESIKSLENKGTVKAKHPNYKAFIPANASRRMASGVKMGVACSKKALEESGLKMPDAIIIGTGMGCIEDSEKFLNALIENDEQYLTPTAFIQSTHNTVGAQIALSLGCKSYNVTYVNGSVSFESALIDAQLMMRDEDIHEILVGGVDELGAKFIEQIALFESKEDKPIQVPFSEGASFFTLSDFRTKNAKAILLDVETFSEIQISDIEVLVESFLDSNSLTILDVDTIILGNNGDDSDIYYDAFQNVLKTASVIQYKHLCGEFYTASAFGFWCAVNILELQEVPKSLIKKDNQSGNYKKILLYNQFKGRHHSFTLLSKC